MQHGNRRWGMMALAIAVWAGGTISGAFAVEAPGDVSGAWTFAVKTDRGSGNPSFVFKQEGKTLKGTYRGFFGEAPLEGTMDGRAIKFSFKARSPLNPLFKVNITYSGTLDQAAGTLSGTVDFDGQGSGTWTGKRKPEETK